MCEFKVFIRDGEVRKVYDDVVYVKINGETIVLKDVLGIRKAIPSAIIEEVDVQSETLKLRGGSIIGKLLVFLNRYDDLISRGTYSGDVERLWEDVKREGDAMVERLRASTYK